MSYDIDLSGRVALVTGASSGLGAQFARVLARACGHVAGADRFIWGIDDSALSRLGLRLDDYQPILARFLDEWQIVDMYEVGAR